MDGNTVWFGRFGLWNIRTISVFILFRTDLTEIALGSSLVNRFANLELHVAVQTYMELLLIYNFHLITNFVWG